MHLPPEIRAIVEEHADALGFAALKRAAAALSEAYRAGDAGRLSHLPAAERAAAYLVTRFPATYAAAFQVLEEVRARLGDRPVESVLDIGAGTGAASLAARHWFTKSAITMIERDGAFAQAARECLPGANLRMDDAARMDAFPPHDLVLACYSVGEMAAGRPLAALVERAWRAARVALVVMEPGTPAGFERIRAIRDGLLAAGAEMIAPCPAESPCPMAAPDWCHFAARLERSSLHRRLKAGEQSYEDEKFSYVAVAREAVPLARARIIRRPEHHHGLVVLETCRGAETASERVMHRDRERFRAARQARWGGEWEW